MKTKELIDALRAADPTGEEECCVDGVDILYVDNLPAGYDGAIEVLRRDPAKRPHYDVVGAEIRRVGRKVVIHSHSIREALRETPDLPVELLNPRDRDVEELARWRSHPEEE